jgi:c-di-AMP phosphodiesterase-like protein
MVKMTLTFDEETIETLRIKAKEEGFVRPSLLVRYLLLRSLKESTDAELEETDNKTVPVKIDNYQEILTYVREKKFGRVESFITYAVAQHMARYPLTDGQKRRSGKSIGNADIPAQAVQLSAL